MKRRAGFTLIELLVALLILSLLAMMSRRGLEAVLATRERVLDETSKWQDMAAFCTRFERDLAMASPRPVRLPGGGEAAGLDRASRRRRVDPGWS